MPKVSIIIPTYNASQFLGEAIKSILNQSFQDFELIIWDSASSDTTETIAKKNRDERIKFESLPFLCPSAIKRNLGIHQSKGEYIAMMDADDLMHKDRLKEQVNFFKKNPSIDIVGSNFTIFGNFGAKPRIQPENDPQIKAKLLLINGNAIHTPTTLVRRSFLEEKSQYFPGKKTDEDHALWINCLKSGAKFYNLQKPLLFYRKHEKSYTAQNASRYIQGKTDLRAELLSIFFNNLTHAECFSLANLMINKRNRVAADLETALLAIKKIYKSERCEFGADLGLIKNILGHYYAKARRNVSI